MKIDLKPLGFRAGEALNEFVVRRISAALCHQADHVQRVIVRLMDQNGPRGGLDKLCRVELVYRQGMPAVVTANSSDYYSAVEVAARRLGRASERQLDRRRF